MLAAAPAAFGAGNVDLSTVPKRNTVQLDDLQQRRPDAGARDAHGHVQEGRQPAAILLGQYADRPDFGAASVPDHADKLDVLDTTFPHDKPQMLYWNVQSDFDGEATIEITYFTSGITWSADYLCVADKDEKQTELRRVRPRQQPLAARNTKTPRCGWWSARSTWSRRSPSWRRCRSAK